MGHFARDCPTQDLQPTKALGRLHHTLEAETPIGRSLLNEFFNKLMQSERKQEIAKAKLKKARQQLNVQVNPQQVQAGGNAPVATPAQATVIPAGSPTVTPPQANVPRKVQVGRPAKVAKPKPAPLAAAAATAPKKVTPPKPPVTRSKTRNQPAPTSVAAADIEADAAAPVEVDNDTDGLAELPTDSESEATDSGQEEENVQLEGQWQLTLEGEKGDKILEQVLNIKVDGSSAARIVVNIEGQDKVALIDTGAGRCCMNEEQYRTLGSPPLESQDVGFQL